MVADGGGVMACGSCSGQAAQDYVVTYSDGTTKTFTAAEGGVAAARIEAAKHRGATLKVAPRK